MQKRSGAAAGRGRATARPRTLAIDVGGTGLKASVLDPRGGMITDRLRVATPAPAPAKVLVDALVGLVAPLGGFERRDRSGLGLTSNPRGLMLGVRCLPETVATASP